MACSAISAPLSAHLSAPKCPKSTKLSSNASPTVCLSHPKCAPSHSPSLSDAKASKTPFLSAKLRSKRFSDSSELQEASSTALSARATRAGLLDFLTRPKRASESKQKEREELKNELFEILKPLDRGCLAASEDEEAVEEVVQKLEALNPTKAPLQSPAINGKWELKYTTSQTILRKNLPKFIRKMGPVYQCIDTNTLQAQNIETWPLFNQVKATLTPLSSKKVDVKFDFFKICGLITVKAPENARGDLEITYLDDDTRIARGNRGNLFVLTMVDPDYVIN